MKRISHFLPTTRLPADEAERHYTRIHHPFARAALARSPTMIRYTTHLVLGELDVTGHFEQRPSLWRFVVTENVDPEPGADAIEWLPASLTQLFWQDHANFLRGLCSFEVDEAVALDSRTGQTAFAKVILRWSIHDTGDDPRWASTTSAGQLDDARATYRDRRLPRLLELLDEASGIRLAVSNTVLDQLETLPVDEPDQRFSGRRLPHADALAFDELWFDNVDDAARAFSHENASGLLHSAGLRASGFHVAETCGFDRR